MAQGFRKVQLRYRYVNSLEDMQKIYKIAASRTTVIESDKPYQYTPGLPTMRRMTVVNDSERYYKITTMWVVDQEQEDGSIEYKDIYYTDVKKYVCTWIFDKTGENNAKIHPTSVSKRANAVYKPYNIVKEKPNLFDRDKYGKIWQSASPTIGFNQKFDKTEHHVVCYDLNSAYATVLVDKIIDTYNMRVCDTVKENEVGFMWDHNLTMVHKGSYADYVFPLIDSPYKDFARKYYKLKKTAPKGSDERAIAKQILVITVGLWQNVNPFLRAFVVNSCNEIIDNLRVKYKDKICMWNTDAVYCTEHIKELDDLLGDDIGQFKVEYEGLFRQSGSNYQKVDSKEVTYRGVMKMLFKEDYNILIDDLPKGVLPYRVNKETLKIEANPEFAREIQNG